MAGSSASLRPLPPSSTDSPRQGRFLPGHGAARLLVDSAFTPSFDATAALFEGLLWLVGVTVVGVVVVSVLELPSASTMAAYGGGPAYHQLQEEHAATAVDAVASRLDGSTVVVERVVVDGQPAKTICKLAQDRDVDLVVVGHRSVSGAERLVFGSVSAQGALLVGPPADGGSP